ncbi:putrescine aminopropyltransferase [Fusarium oxysporum]|nr:putrescine aminopropyltransferase [Fusarium oxysporum]
MSSEEITHPTIKDGWFREISDMWPGHAMTLPRREGPRPREEQVPGCPHLQVHRLRQRSGPRQRYPVHRA